MSADLRVVVTDYNFPSLDTERAILGEMGAEIEAHQCGTEEEVVRVARGANVLLVQFAPIGAAVLDVLAPNATVVRYGVGVDNVDLGAARARSIDVAYVPDYCMNEVADHASTLILALLRRLPQMQSQVASGGWGLDDGVRGVQALEDTTIGIVGYGRIGRAVRKRLSAFDCRFLVYDPELRSTNADERVRQVSDLSFLLREADAVTLHLPLTDGTRHLLDKSSLQDMKPTAVLVNTSRGALIDEEALGAALRRRTIAAAALDVFEDEPLPATSRLRSLPNVLLTPHLAWFSESAMGRLQRLAGEEAARALRNEPLRCPVSPPS